MKTTIARIHTSSPCVSPVALGLAKKEIRYMPTADTVCAGELEPERLRADTNDVWIEVVCDQMVTLTPGLKRHVSLRGRKPTKFRWPRRVRTRCHVRYTVESRRILGRRFTCCSAC